MFGFIIIRHVNNELSDQYWKECYKCIRKFYDNPIMIIDDSSDKKFLNDISLTNCNVIYDTEHKGAGEILPYYYFHKLKPFDTAVIIHDSVFIQSYINFEINDNIKYLWSFENSIDDWDHDLFEHISNLCKGLVNEQEILQIFHQKSKWKGCFGVMSVIKWDFLNLINERHEMFKHVMPRIITRGKRCVFERVFSMITHFNDNITTQFGDIHSYIKWGLPYSEYLTNDYHSYPIIKVWSGR